MAPDFAFTTVDDKMVPLASLRGSPVIISFVLTVGCVPCKVEALNIRAAQQQKTFKVIQLSVNHREKTEDLKAFQSNFGNPDWMIGFDKDLIIAQLYDARAIDTTIIVDASGKIIYRDNGYPIQTETILNLLPQ